MTIAIKSNFPISPNMQIEKLEIVLRKELRNKRSQRTFRIGLNPDTDFEERTL